jgi:hypothetical protein
MTTKFGTWKNDVRCEAFQLLPEQIEVVEDGEVLRCVAESGQRGQKVRLGFPIGCLHLLAQILIDRRGADSVEKGEDFEVLFHVIWCV